MAKGLNFIKHAALVEQAKKWLEKAHGTKFACGVVLTEYNCWLPEIPDVIGFSADRSILIECKVSRTDFLADKKKFCRQRIKQLGNLRYYLVLPNVACAEDINNGWGLLYVFDKEIREVKESEYFSADSVKAAEWSIFYSIIRRVKLRGSLAGIQKPQKEE